jgi:VanZ family protein
MFLQKMKWALFWALFIFILCAIPGHDIPHISFLEMLSFDKFVHAGMFFIQALLLIRAFRLQHAFSFLTNYPRITAFFLCVTYGGTLELMQGAFFIERTASVFDFMANSIGTVAAISLYSPIEKKYLTRFLK